MRTLVPAGAAIALIMTLSFGEVFAGSPVTGLNLSWDDCGAFGVETRTFACDTNAGQSVIVGSFLPPAGVDSLIGCEIVIDISSKPSAIPDWWSFRNPSTCRQSSMVTSFDFTAGPLNCTDYWAGRGFESSTYDIGFETAADRARLLAATTLLFGPSDGPGPADQGTEYYAFKITIDHEKTVGTGACAGCEIPVCIVFNQIVLRQPGGGARDVTITSPADRYHVIWQPPRSDCPTVVPARNRTWGSIKAIYR